VQGLASDPAGPFDPAPTHALTDLPGGLVPAGDDRLLAFLSRPATEVAPELIGAIVVVGQGEDTVGVRLTEVEAYLGPDDPGSHAYSGVPTARTWPMFGPAGHVYVYRSYGIHSCVNVVCGRDGHATGVLLRGGEVVVGVETARARRAGIDDRRLARGPGNMGQSLGLTTADSGRPIGSGRGLAIALPERPLAVVAGGRVGVSGAGGDPIAYPWRFVESGAVGVSSYRGGLRDGRSGQPGARRWHDSARPYAAEPTR